MAKKSRKDRKKTATKQNVTKQSLGEQNVKPEEKLENAGVEAQETEAVIEPKDIGEKTETAVEEAAKKAEEAKQAEEEAAAKKAAEEAAKKAAEEAAAKEEAAKKAAEEAAAKKAAEEAEKKALSRATFERRFVKHLDELKWLYMELYGNSSMFAELSDNLYRFYEERNEELKEIDLKREEYPDWYKQNDMLGMMFYIDNFGGNMKGVEDKLEYLEKSNVNYVHLMPFLDTVEGRSDGGYAVADFRKVQEKLGTMEDLESLTAACHKKNINVCMDFVMNHTSEDLSLIHI